MARSIAGKLRLASLPGLRAAAQSTPPLRRSLKGLNLDDPLLLRFFHRR